MWPGVWPGVQSTSKRYRPTASTSPPASRRSAEMRWSRRSPRVPVAAVSISAAISDSRVAVAPEPADELLAVGVARVRVRDEDGVALVEHDLRPRPLADAGRLAGVIAVAVTEDQGVDRVERDAQAAELPGQGLGALGDVCAAVEQDVAVGVADQEGVRPAQVVTMDR